MTATAHQPLTIRARAFAGEGIRQHLVLVDADGVVRVWDSVAGHYTTCHGLSQSAVQRIQRLARG